MPLASEEGEGHAKTQRQENLLKLNRQKGKEIGQELNHGTNCSEKGAHASLPQEPHLYYPQTAFLGGSHRCILLQEEDLPRQVI